MKKDEIKNFQQEIWRYYQANRRSFPWRDRIDPYWIFVSEIMLQQTQADRVVSKFLEFIQTFPDFQSLASAPLAAVIAKWQGLGYNRRAKYLKDSASIIVNLYHGTLPDDPAQLEKLPGIGKATAASITTFAYNKPIVFIETNVRTVFIHFFFHDQDNIADTSITPLVELTLSKDQPRDWYYALMDYGVYLKKNFKNPSRKSKNYKRQSTLKGSSREIRGWIIKNLTQSDRITITNIKNAFPDTKHNIDTIICDLEKEGMLKVNNGNISL